MSLELNEVTLMGRADKAVHEVDALILGAGLTGLTVAYLLRKQGLRVVVVERSERAGGQIHTRREKGFIYETGPNTGIISNLSVQRLFDSLSDRQLLALAKPSAKRRLILKNGRFTPLPTGLVSAVSTNLFTWGDKLRILAEPYRAKGGDPDESVASLVERRLGSSYLRYAVDPFVGGIYAGDPYSLVTRHALPKLYALEQQYGSFIAGAVAKMRERDSSPRPSKAVFSAEGGLSALIGALVDEVGMEYIYLNSTLKDVVYHAPHDFLLNIQGPNGGQALKARNLISTVGSYALAEALPFLPSSELKAIEAMRYAPVVQVALGYLDVSSIDFDAFGGLIPSIEDEEVLGVLNPSACFPGRAPEGGLLLSVFLGGMRCPQLIQRTDSALEELVYTRLKSILGIYQRPDLIHISRHRYAIPQYEQSTDERLAAIASLQTKYSGLYLAGGIRDGIGMADRIAQAYTIADSVR